MSDVIVLYSLKGFNGLSLVQFCRTHVARYYETKDEENVAVHLYYFTVRINVESFFFLQFQTTIPHSYGAINCCVDGVIKLRKDLMAEGVKVSVNDFIIKAVAVSLQVRVKNRDRVIQR